MTDEQRDEEPRDGMRERDETIVAEKEATKRERERESARVHGAWEREEEEETEKHVCGARGKEKGKEDEGSMVERGSRTCARQKRE